MTDITHQRDAFVAKEGDGYYARNGKALAGSSKIREFLTQRIAHHCASYNFPKVLEIGCSSGGNLESLNRILPICACGVDPSAEAVRVGLQAYPNFDLKVGTADALPFDDHSIDLVWFAFCLYLVDRSLVARVVAEADRVLKDGGLLAIHDFDPDVPTTRPYAHYPGIKSYKMDYSGLFLCTPAYSLIEKQSFTHDALHWSIDPQERLALWMCRRQVDSGYRNA